MFCIVVIYLILQLAATIFLYFQHENQAFFHIHLALTALAMTFYGLAHFINPGFINT